MLTTCEFVSLEFPSKGSLIIVNASCSPRVGSKGFGERFGVVSSDTRGNLLQEAKALPVGERAQAVLEHVRRPCLFIKRV